MLGEFAEQPHDDDFAGTGVTTDPDLTVDAVGSPPGATDDDDDAAGVLARGLGGDLDRLVGSIVIDDDDEGEDPAQGQGPDLVAQLDQLLADGRGRGRGEVDDHGFLHTRPSRASIRSLDAGPHPPDGYGSGLPCRRHQASIGSRICQDNSTSS